MQAILAPYGVLLDRSQMEAVRRQCELLLLWNQRVSLTSVRQPQEILERHFGESMFAAGQVPIEHGRLADVGSGAGFPGLALKLICPRLQVTLIEPNAKKAAFLAEVRRELKLADVEIERRRIEELGAGFGVMDYVTARAVGRLDQLVKWAQGVLKVGGLLVLWVGERDRRRIIAMQGVTWREPIRIPMSERRFLLVGKISALDAS